MQLLHFHTFVFFYLLRPSLMYLLTSNSIFILTLNCKNLHKPFSYFPKMFSQSQKLILVACTLTESNQKSRAVICLQWAVQLMPTQSPWTPCQPVGCLLHQCLQLWQSNWTGETVLVMWCNPCFSIGKRAQPITSALKLHHSCLWIHKLPVCILSWSIGCTFQYLQLLSLR